MKSNVQLCLDSKRVNELDAEYCREWWIAALLNNGCWPSALGWGVKSILACTPWHAREIAPGQFDLHSLGLPWWAMWFLSFPVMERELIEDAVARLNRESNTEPLPMAGLVADAGARSAPARP